MVRPRRARKEELFAHCRARELEAQVAKVFTHICFQDGARDRKSTKYVHKAFANIFARPAH